MYIKHYYFYYAIAQHCSMVLCLRRAICKMFNYVVFMPLQGSDVCCFDGFVNFGESGVKSESEKGVVNSRLSEFHVCWVRVGANLLSRN